jgi:hypothetical protein
MFRSCPSNCCNHNSWKLEGSDDNLNWILIDNQINRNWITTDLSDVYFPVQSKEPFSYFRFTKTGKNTYNSDYFQLNYLDFFGAI